MKKCLLLLALVCLLGNRTLAEDLTIDFSTFGGSGQPNVSLTWENNNHPVINGQSFPSRFWVQNPNDWGFYGSSTFNQTYLQKKENTNNTKVYISDMKTGDLVTIWGESGDQGGGCNVTSNNIKNSSSGSTNLQFSSGTPSHTFTMNGDGTLELEFYNRYSGIRKITVQSQQQQQQTTPVFNYDPGFEVYDMFEVFTNNGVSYSTSDAGFTLNGGTAQYVNLSNNANLTLNERIAVNPTSGWSFNRGLQAPNYSINNNAWYNFSICNLKEGDRVIIYYTGTAPTFSSQGKDGAYNGCSAFKDTGNDGDFNSDKGDHNISQGMSVEKIDALDRVEGRISDETGHGDIYLYTSAVYVITQDGHLDLGIQNGSDTRIVKIKIYSDHQATMVDEYDQPNKTYWAHFDVTGELKAKEHIVPGGLEVHVGNNDEDQHAIVVSSKFGPMSYVNAARRFKIPGIEATDIEGTDKGTYTINFNLTSQLPETGTYYKFIAQEEGDMKVKFQGNSMYYYRYDLAGDAIYYNTDQNHEHNDWEARYDRANEQTFGQPSTYYLMEEGSNGAPIQKVEKSVANGSAGEITYHLEKGKVYYLYGVWSDGAALDNRFYIQNPDEVDKQGKIPYTCGVAELYDVEFTPTKKIHPLAKWVPSGTQADEDLADVTGYVDNDLTIKKMTGNITACTPYIEGGKLKIKDIQFAEGKNPAGVVLIKIGDKSDRYDPVYAFTVAYSADAQYDDENADGSRGHTWDFSSNSLNGLTWNYPYSINGATSEDLGTYFEDYFNKDLDENKANGGSLLWREMNYQVGGIDRSDWMFNYRIERADGNNSDPRFLSKYDMEGDNADMLYDTEGMILLTSSNQACIFNEFKGNDVHSSATDPDRYVGILPGGSFLIPWLEPEDRVIIWMGSGVGTGNEQMVFNIENAYDAKHTLITSNDEYVAGGSQWNGNNGDNNYRGCYHFFAKDKGDMVFRMIAGSMCKIYKIQIYRGDRIKTNDLVPVDDSPLYLLTEKGSEKSVDGTYSIHYLGKGQSIGEPEMAGMTGNLTAHDATLAALSDNISVKFTSSLKDKFGVFNMRLNDMERNNKYVADFADRNFPVDYYEGMQHPYTWDFTDVNRFNTTYLASENSKYSADDLNIWDAETNFTWKRDDELLFVPGGQIYADAQMIAEAAGIQFTPINMGNGTIKATNDGLRIEGGDLNENDVNALSIENITGGSYAIGSTEQKAIWEDPNGSSERTGWKLTIPNLPNLTAVYIRVQTIEGKDPKLTFNFSRGSGTVNDWNFFKKTIDNNDGTKDIIVGLSPSLGGSDMPYDIFLNNVIVKKIATSKDIKPAFGKTGYQTESRHREIDHRLTGFFTGETIEAYYGTLGKNDKNEQVVVLHPVNIMDKADPDYTGDGITGDEDAEVNWRNSEDIAGKGCILYHVNGTEAADGKIDRTLSILDGGFHLFVPDMHDMDVTTGEDDLGGPDDISDNILWARFYNADVWSWGTRVDKTVPGLAEKNSDGSINYALSAKHYNRQEQLDKGNGYDVGFYHVDENGAEIGTHASYVRMGSGSTQQSKIFFTFDDGFFYEDHGIATQIDDASHLIDNGQLTTDHADWYNLNGQKLSGKPSANGLYIKNGKKVIIK